MTKKRIRHQRGFTLIELLLYTGIVGALLLGVSLFFVTVTDSMIKNQTVAEVEQQGALAMEHITQAIRNADSITSPTAGATSDTLTLAMADSGVNPTVFSLDGSGGSGGTAIMGYDQDGGTTSEMNGGVIRTSKFVASSSGTVSTLRALIGPTVGGPASNKSQMALYTGSANPTTLLANSGSITVTPSGWNSFSITPTAVTAGQTYWLAYNTNAASSAENNVRFHSGGSGQSRTQVHTYNDWPASFSGLSVDWEFSMYAEIATTAPTGNMQIREGTGSNIVLANDKVVFSNLTFSNLSRSGTPGIVQVSFTLARKNPGGRNEYSYQKTFTSSAALRWSQ